MTTGPGASGPGASGPLGIPVLEDLPDPGGRRVLVRADLDLPSAAAAPPSRLRRLQQLEPTLRWLGERGAVVTVCGHQGPLGEPGDPDEFAHTADSLRRLFPGVAVLPNLSEGDGSGPEPSWLATLVEEQDLYVNDAFGWCSTPLVSIVGPPSLLPSAAGRRLQADLELLGPFLVAPERPFVVVLGSRQPPDRLHGLQGMVLRADTVLVGGQMSLPFLQALGRQPPGEEPDEFIEECRRAYGVSREVLHAIHLPSDLVWERPDGSAVTAVGTVEVAGSIGDIGPRTSVDYAEVVRGAGSVLWLGSLGKVEDPRFAEGTLAVARALLAHPERAVLGGDALLDLLARHDALPARAGVLSATGSSATLLKVGDLPGLAALRQGPRRPSG